MMSGNFFESLKEQRLARKITLEEISGSTRINIGFLRAIEEGRLDVLPPVYVRIFFKNYISRLGLDTAMALEQFDRLARQPAATGDEPIEDGGVPDEPQAEPDAEGGGDPENGLDPLKRVFPFAIGVVLIFFIGYFLVGRSGQTENRSVSAPVEAVEEGSRTDAPEPVPAAAVSAPAAAPESLQVRVAALKYFWLLLVRDDCDTVYSGFLQKDDDLTIPARDSVFIKIGLSETGADAAEVFLGGVSLGTWGKAGTRLTKFRIGADGIIASSLRERPVETAPADSAVPADSSADTS